MSDEEVFIGHKVEMIYFFCWLFYVCSGGVP